MPLGRMAMSCMCMQGSLCLPWCLLHFDETWCLLHFNETCRRRMLCRSMLQQNTNSKGEAFTEKDVPTAINVVHVRPHQALVKRSSSQNPILQRHAPNPALDKHLRFAALISGPRLI